MDYILKVSAIYQGLSPKDICKLAFQLGKANALSMPLKWSETQQAGADWFTGFLKCHLTFYQNLRGNKFGTC